MLPLTLADPCQGPFDPTYTEEGTLGIWALGSTEGDYLPQLSANGQVVAFLSSAREIAAGEAFTSQPSNDLYVADMRAGFTRVQALRRLTELAGASLGQASRSRTAPVVDLGISPDGSQIAFSTLRTVFPLGSPAYVSAPAAEAGIAEIYSVDLGNDTLTRVTQGFDGEQSEPAGGVSGSPSFSADDDTLAFSSTAVNLVYGDGNAPHGEARNGFDGSDAFVVHRKQFSPTPAESFISTPPGGPQLVQAWRLGVTARSRRDGSVLLDVLVPGAGALSAQARGAIRAPVPARTAARAHRHRPTAIVAVRTVASSSVIARESGVVELVLKLAPAYRTLAAQRGGLSGSVLVSFVAPGHPVVHATITTSFVYTGRSPSHVARRISHRRRTGRAGR